MRNWQVHWRDLPTGAPIHPYASIYQDACREVLSQFRFDPVTFVEIGVYDGCSARIISDEIDHREDALLYLIDPNKHDLALEVANLAHVQFLQTLAEDIHDSFEVIHFLHVDMSPHTFEQHKTIHELYSPKVVPRGIMMIHDYAPQYGTYEFVNEVLLQDSNWDVTFYKPSPEFGTPPVKAVKLF